MKRKLKIIAMFSLVVAMIISLNASTLVGSIFANENDTDKMSIQIERDNEKDVYVDDILNYTITIKNQSEKSIMDSQIDLHLSDGLRLQEESILIDQKNSNKVSLDEKTGMYQISIGNKDEEKFVMSGNSTTILTFSAQMVNTGTQEIKTALMGSVDVEEIHKLIENKDSVTILEKEQASEKQNIEESKGIISNENTLEEIANIYSVMYDENNTKATIQFDFQYLDKKGVEVENLICTKDNVVLFDKETKDNHLSYEVLGNGIVEFNMVYRNKDDINKKKHNKTFTVTVDKLDTSLKDITFKQEKQELNVDEAIVNTVIGEISSKEKDIVYKMEDSKNSKLFSVNQDGTVSLREDIHNAGDYAFSVIASKGVDAVKIEKELSVREAKKELTANDAIIRVSKITDGTVVGEYKTLDELNNGISTVGEYKIQFLQDFTLDANASTKLNNFLDNKTTRFIISGLHDDGKTTSKLTISNSWEIGGHNNAEGNLFEDLRIRARLTLAVFANGNKTIFGNNIVMDTDIKTKAFTLIGGGNGKDVNETNLIIKSGSYHYILAGSYNGNVKNGTHVTLEGGTVNTLSLGGFGKLDKVFQTGNISSTSTMDIKGGQVARNIYIIGGYLDESFWDVIPVNTSYPGIILGNVEVNLSGGTIAAVNSICSPYKKSGDMSNRGYIEGDLTFNISGDVNVKNYSLKEVYGSKGVGGTYSVNIEGNPTIPVTFKATSGKRISANPTSLNFRKECAEPNTTFMNFDQVNIGDSSETRVELGAIKAPDLANTKDTILTLKNNSRVSFVGGDSVIGDLVGDNKENSLNSPIIVVTKGHPISISNAINKDSIFQITETGTPTVSDPLITFTASYQGTKNISFFKKADPNINIAEKKDTKEIVVSDKTFSVSLTNVIQASFASEKKKELKVNTSIIAGDANYNYGTFSSDVQGSTKRSSCAYLSTNETFDENWMKTEIVPTDGIELYLTPHVDNTVVATSLSNVQIDEKSKYYLHLRTVAQDYIVIPLDLHGAHADIDTSIIPKQDAEGLKYGVKLTDTEFNDGAPAYVASGIKQVAYSLVKDNANALKEQFEEHAGEDEQLYGIQAWTEGNVSEDYVLTIPQEIIDKMKDQNLSEVYLYTKDNIGNTSETPIYVGQDFMGVRVPTKVSIYTLKGKRPTLVAPILTITNFGKQKVNIDMQMKSYSDKVDTLSLVNDKTTYADNELALSLLPQENAAFTKTNVRNIEAAPFNIGSIDIMNKANLDNIRFTFEAAYDAEKIDGTLEANTFTLEYYLTPVK